MNFSKIDLDETHIRLTTDLERHGLERFVISIRNDLKNHILKNKDFQLSFEPVDVDDDSPLIVRTMADSSRAADVGPMACVAGTISQMSLDYLMGMGSRYSIVENGGDIALINDTKVLCGIYSNNPVLGNDIAFEIKARRKPLGICSSSGRIGHSISFGDADSVTVISGSCSVADGLATRIANEIRGETSEDKISNGLECCENYREFFDGVLIISDEHVASIGRIPKLVETADFDVNFQPQDE